METEEARIQQHWEHLAEEETAEQVLAMETQELTQSARAHYEQSAAIASLEHHPGFQSILEWVNSRIQFERKEPEDMAKSGITDSAALVKHLYAVSVLNDLLSFFETKKGEHAQLSQERRLE